MENTALYFGEHLQNLSKERCREQGKERSQNWLLFFWSEELDEQRSYYMEKWWERVPPTWARERRKSRVLSMFKVQMKHPSDTGKEAIGQGWCSGRSQSSWYKAGAFFKHGSVAEGSRPDLWCMLIALWLETQPPTFFHKSTQISLLIEFSCGLSKTLIPHLRQL